LLAEGDPTSDIELFRRRALLGWRRWHLALRPVRTISRGCTLD
jgi:hypothetical protein